MPCVERPLLPVIARLAFARSTAGVAVGDSGQQHHDGARSGKTLQRLPMLDAVLTARGGASRRPSSLVAVLRCQAAAG